MMMVVEKCPDMFIQSCAESRRQEAKQGVETSPKFVNFTLLAITQAQPGPSVTSSDDQTSIIVIDDDDQV